MPTFASIAGLEHFELQETAPDWNPRPSTAATLAAISRMKALQEHAIHDMVLPCDDGLAHPVQIATVAKLKLGDPRERFPGVAGSHSARSHPPR